MAGHPPGFDAMPTVRTRLFCLIYFRVVSRNMPSESFQRGRTLPAVLAEPVAMLLDMIIKGVERHNPRTAWTLLITVVLSEVDTKSVFLVMLLTFITFACWMC